MSLVHIMVEVAVSFLCLFVGYGAGRLYSDWKRSIEVGNTAYMTRKYVSKHANREYEVTLEVQELDRADSLTLVKMVGIVGFTDGLTLEQLRKVDGDRFFVRSDELFRSIGKVERTEGERRERERMDNVLEQEKMTEEDVVLNDPKDYADYADELFDKISAGKSLKSLSDAEIRFLKDNKDNLKW